MVEDLKMELERLDISSAELQSTLESNVSAARHSEVLLVMAYILVHLDTGALIIIKGVLNSSHHIVYILTSCHSETPFSR